MKTDVEIAQEARLEPIESIADRTGIMPDEIEPYGRYKAKLSLEILKRLQDKPEGKLILVTAITPPLPEKGRPQLP